MGRKKMSVTRLRSAALLTPNPSVKLAREAMKRFAQLFAIIVGIWSLVALCNSAVLYWLELAQGLQASLSKVMRGQFADAWIWAALTPVVFLISHRFPLNRRPIALAGAVHLGSFLTLSGVHCLVAQGLNAPLQYPVPNYGGPILVLRFLENFFGDIWMYWPLVVIQGLIDSHARTRERDRVASRLETELAKARLELLRAQIQPHFLFNTLHSIASLVRLDRRAAEEMVVDLAELLRASFADPARQETALRRELELVRCYMSIQTRRFSDRLDVAYRVSEGTLDAAVPVLVLQPLVENAVMHGVIPAGRPCTIEVSSVRRADELVLRVTDDGVGLEEPVAPGVGLSNIGRRLKGLYGDRQSFELTARQGGGAVATVRLPWRHLDGGRLQAAAHDENPILNRG